ncbi:MAG: 30S ribosomal protein S20 [Planctomycetota bacterium]|nr:30S ribosomal protein S20 [Planctomycetota bacterium]
MAHSKSAKKRVRQNQKRRLINRWRKSAVKDSIRAFDEAVAAGKTDEAAAKLKEVYKRLDKTAAKGTIHKNTVARKKSRLAKRLSGKSTG